MVLSMYKSILRFLENDIKEIEEILGKVLMGEKDTDDLSKEVLNRVMTLANRWICEMYEKVDGEIRDSISRKNKWTIEKRNEPKELLDVVGTLHFERTGYEDKKTGKYIYLLDKVLGFEGHQRITIGAAAQILEECIVTSYEKGGKAASPTDSASKQAVKKLVHEIDVDFPQDEVKEKKKMRHLHIVADEDHVAAQFWNKKGDLERNSVGNKINTIMPKIIVLYEDVINESGENSENPRYRLIGKHTFTGVYKGTSANLGFWEQVREYIEENYDTKVLERVYIAGDGAAWIKASAEVLENSRFVLDKFHMMKYVNISVTHLFDSASDVKSEIWECLNGADKEGLKEIYNKILMATDPGNKYDEVEKALKYFFNQWSGIKIRTTEAGGCWKCCAEGQVSHVLSARLSSRPMGWSETGCHQMAKLRAHHFNGGKIIDILKYQKKKKAKEEYIEEQNALIKELRKRQSGWKYEEELYGDIPGLETHSMKWMRDIIRKAL